MLINTERISNKGNRLMKINAIFSFFFESSLKISIALSNPHITAIIQQEYITITPPK